MRNGGAEGSLLVGDGGQVAISLTPDADGTSCFLDGLNSIYLSDVWIVAIIFSHR